MHRRVVRAALAAVVLAGSGAAWGLSTGSASAGSELPVVAGPIALPQLTSVSGVVVDGPRRRILAADPNANRIVVLDYAGRPLTGPDVDITGPGAMTMSPDRRTLYVASAGSEIVELDAAGLTVRARHPIGSGRVPTQVVPAGGRIWFSFRETGTYGNWGSLDPADDTVQVHEHASADTPQEALLAVSPTDPDLLAVSTGVTLTDGKAYLYDVSGGAEREVARLDLGNDGISNYRQLTFTPDGGQLFLGGYGGKAFLSVPGPSARPGLSLVATVPTGGFAEADGTPGAGTMVADTPSGYGPDLALFPPGATTPSREWEFPITGRYPPGIAAVAWEPGGARVFLVADNVVGEHSLWTIEAPATTATTLKLTAPPTATRAAALPLKGTLAGVPAGTAVSVQRKDLETPAGKTLPVTPRTAADGTFTLTDTPPAGGTVTYTATYAGDALHRPATSTAAVTVSRAAPAVTISGNGVVHAYNTTATVTAHLGATYKNRTVEIWADPYGGDLPNKLLKRATVDSKGNVSATLRLTRTTSLSAVFTGDARYAARTVKAVAHTKVAASTTLRGNYKTATISAASYAHFRATVHPRLTTAMTPYPKRRQKLQFEYYSAGTWKVWQAPVLAADATYTLTGTHKTGVRYRVRPAYLSGTTATTAGDTVNYTTYGAWKYFTFTK